MPNNFLPFELHKKHLTAMRFATDAELKQAVTSWLQTLCPNTLHVGVKRLGATVRKVLICQWWIGGKVWCVPSATNVTWVRHIWDISFSMREFVTLFLEVPLHVMAETCRHGTQIKRKWSFWKTLYIILTAFSPQNKGDLWTKFCIYNSFYSTVSTSMRRMVEWQVNGELRRVWRCTVKWSLLLYSYCPMIYNPFYQTKSFPYRLLTYSMAQSPSWEANWFCS